MKIETNNARPLILRLTPFFYYPRPEQGWPIDFDPVGGMQLQTWQETQILSQHQAEQIVLTLGMKGVPSQWHMDTRTIVQVARIPWPMIRSELEGTWQLVSAWGLGTLWWIARKWAQRSRLREQISLIHCHCDGTLWPLWIGPIFASLLRVPLVFTIHCSRLATYEPMTKVASLLQPYAQCVERRAIAAADHVITLTQRVADIYIQEKLQGRESVSVIPDVVDLQRFSAQKTGTKRAYWYQRFSIPEDKSLLLFAGRIAHEKGWPYLVQAISLLKHLNIHLLLCGDGPQRKRLEQMIRHLGLEEYVTITGFLPYEDMPGVYELADIFVLPSIHEELGSSLLEAMSMQLPIVATHVGGVPNIIRHEYNGLLVEPKSPEVLAKAIERLLVERVLAEKLAEQGNEFVRNQYGVETKFARIREVYRQLHVNI